MTIKKSDFFLNFMMFCLGATVGRRIGDPYLMRHLAAKSADLMLVNLPHCIWSVILLRGGLHGAFLVASLMYDNPSDIDIAFSKGESPIVVHQCRMPMRQTVCRTAKTPRKTPRVIDP
jgi:hypothetical protein